MKKSLYLSLLIVMSLAACQNEQTNTAKAAHETASPTTAVEQHAITPKASTVAVTKDAVQHHAKDLQADMAKSKAVEAAKQLTETNATDAAAVKAAQAAKAAKVAKATQAAKAAGVAKAAQAAKAAGVAKAAQVAKAAEVAKAAQAAKAVQTVKTIQAAPKVQLAATGDAVKGKSLARKCMSCHNFTARKKVGPGLKGIFARKAGIMSDMRYGKSLAAGGWTWDEKNLAIWLCDSKKSIKTLSGDASAKTKMPNQRICDATKQANIIAFLKTL